jgi:hypothetical protein
MITTFSNIDTARAVRLRHLDPQKLKGYAADRNFHYDNLAPVEADWWNRFWRWFWQLLQDAFGNGPAGHFIGYAALIILVALALFVIIRVLGIDLKIFSGKSKSVEIPYMETEDNIHGIDFNEEIDKAIALRNFRLAVRLYYLRILKQLSDADQINWEPGKTNQTYISELSDDLSRHTFKNLTNQFEYVWYGDFSIDQQQFDQLRNGFESFKPKSL